MFGHDCRIYFPKDAKVGDWFTCMCGERWERVGVNGWFGIFNKWKNRGRKR
jgi:hypothetical protein